MDLRYKTGNISGSELIRLARDVMKIWKRLGRALGLNENDLDEIQLDESDAYERSYAMLVTWQRMFVAQASYSKLAEGLLHSTINRTDLVTEYCMADIEPQGVQESTGIPSETEDYTLPKEITRMSLSGDISQGGTSVTILTGKPYHKTYQRQKELEKIDDLYRSLEPASDVITVYLTGPPGSGKSQLSRQYGAQYGQRSHHGEGCVVATLHAETPESLLESYKQLVKELGLCISDNTDEATRVKLKTYSQSVKEYLRNTPTPQWLFIVDNVVASEPLTEFWPGRESSWGVGRVIVTTQDAELVPKSSEYARDLSLARGMEEQDAVGLMYLIADLEIDADAIEVARKLDYYPLSLACAAVFIKEMRTDRPVANYRWTNYLSNLNKYFDDLHYPEFQQHNLCYPRSMLPAAVCAAKRMVSNNRFLASAFEFLSHCALQPIPLEVVADHVMRMCDGCQVPDVVKRDIARCSLLIYPRSGARGIEVVTMHQVMRTAFTHLRLESRDSDSVGDEKCREQRSFLGALDTQHYDTRV